MGVMPEPTRIGALEDTLQSESTGDHKMEVLCGCDEHYVPHAATMICSLLEHNDVRRVHFLCSSISADARAKLMSLATSYKSEVCFYQVPLTQLRQLPVNKWASTAVYYRLLAANLLPDEVEKVLYLDSDIIVRRSLSRLWNADVSAYALAAVSNPERARRTLGLPEGIRSFNSGVLLINLVFWRQHNVAERAISFIMRCPEKIQFWDQDALNGIFASQWLELPTCWNWQDWSRKPIAGKEEDPAIVHFITGDKPWHWSNAHPYKSEYRKYRLKTPWRRYQQEGRPRLRQRLAGSVRALGRKIIPSVFRRAYGGM
jgi:lipopolysaccharide biosynthesis glycosyltransferase